MNRADRKSHKLRALSDLAVVRKREGIGSPRVWQLAEDARYFGASEREIDKGLRVVEVSQ